MAGSAVADASPAPQSCASSPLISKVVGSLSVEAGDEAAPPSSVSIVRSLDRTSMVRSLPATAPRTTGTLVVEAGVAAPVVVGVASSLDSGVCGVVTAFPALTASAEAISNVMAASPSDWMGARRTGERAKDRGVLGLLAALLLVGERAVLLCRTLPRFENENPAPTPLLPGVTGLRPRDSLAWADMEPDLAGVSSSHEAVDSASHRHMHHQLAHTHARARLQHRMRQGRVGGAPDVTVSCEGRFRRVGSRVADRPTRARLEAAVPSAPMLVAAAVCGRASPSGLD